MRVDLCGFSGFSFSYWHKKELKFRRVYGSAELFACMAA